MLTITIPEGEFYNDKIGEFVEVPAQTIQMEHSLLSISKWESKWHKPFLDGKEKTRLETLDYFRCMTISKSVDPLVYSNITAELHDQIIAYMKDPMTATTINDKNPPKGSHRQILTAEVIYYAMASYGIPFECEKWHINRLMTLLRVAEIRSRSDGGAKKMSKADVLKQNRALNAARRKKH